MTRPLLIGQAPGPNTDSRLPLFPVPSRYTGGRLQKLMGITRGEYLLAFDRMNLLTEFPGRHRGDDKFPMELARSVASTVKPLLSGRVVIIVGRSVARAFDLNDMEFHTWTRWSVRRRCLVSRDLGTCWVAVVPHPSGRNHWYNKAENRDKALEFWSEFMRSMP